MNISLNEALGATLRHIAGWIAGGLSARGIIDGTQEQVVIGVVMGLGVLLWSYGQKAAAKRVR